LTCRKNSLKIPKGGNQKPYIDEEQTTQYTKERVQKNKGTNNDVQNNTQKSKDPGTRSALQTITICIVKAIPAKCRNLARVVKRVCLEHFYIPTDFIYSLGIIRYLK
jgi:hypothetical protein